jgi:hypothetical protein
VQGETCHSLANVRPALLLDLYQQPWPDVDAELDLVYAANLLHIAPGRCGAQGEQSDFLSSSRRNRAPLGVAETPWRPLRRWSPTSIRPQSAPDSPSTRALLVLDLHFARQPATHAASIAPSSSAGNRGGAWLGRCAGRAGPRPGPRLKPASGAARRPPRGG